MVQFEEEPGNRRIAADSFYDLLIESLAGLDAPARGQFLSRFLRTVAHVELNEEQSVELWEQVIQRRTELAGAAGGPVSVAAILVDLLASRDALRVPVLMEYDALRRLQISAATDSLTGLANRRMFGEAFERELMRAKRYRHHLAVVLLDLRRLKEVNDRYGHPRGDSVLQTAAATLRRSLRASDFPFRIGGDEFALILPEADPEQARTLANRIHNNFEAIMATMALDLPAALDFGFANFPEDGDQQDTLVQIADERLYKMKQGQSGPARVIPIEAPPRPPSFEPAKRAEAEKPQPAASAGPQVIPSERRRWERVTLTGTKAHAVLGGEPQRSCPVIDLSYGGAALLIEGPEELPDQFSAVLHVPILPPVRVNLRKAYALQMSGGQIRVGCAFAS